MNLFSKIVSTFALVLFTLAQVQGWTVESIFSGSRSNSFARSGYHK